MTNADDMLAVAASRAAELAAPSLSPRPRRNVAVLACMDTRIDLVMLHDPGHSLDERILREQFDW